MSKSLSEQLLGAGLVDKKKVDKARKEKRKEAKANKSKKSAAPDENALRLQQQRAAQIERDRLLNQQRQQQEHDKAVRAQVRQMLEHSRQRVDGDIRFNFKDPRNSKIKHLYVSAAMQNQLSRGQLAICADSDSFAVVPRVVADRIAERFPAAVIFLADQQASEIAEDDPYKDFPIPDDLMW